MAASPAQARYLADAVKTASPARLLVMLYDRLVLDVNRGIEAQQAGDRIEASTHLRHAQDIVSELRSTLKIDAWDGAAELASVYQFVLMELITMSGQPDVARLQKVADIVTGLRDTWRQAAASLLAPAAAPAPVTAPRTTHEAPGRSAAWVA